MRYSQSAAINPDSTTNPAVSIRQLRLWSAPQLIMVATNLTDELTILPHAIFQARQSTAKIVLVYVAGARHRFLNLAQTLSQRRTERYKLARFALDRVVQQLRWVGITCEPLVLEGEPEVEIPRVAQARGVDRLIVAFEDNPDLTSSRSGTLVERILPTMGLPVCVIGRYANLSSPNGLKVNNVTLALSLESDCRVHLAFASRLAQEANAKLTVLHVSQRRNSDWDPSARGLDEVVSRLPFETWRESKVLCPSQIRICEGNPAEQILKHTCSGNAGPIVLCSSGAGSALQNWRNSVSYRVLTEAQYPVFILNRPVSAAEIVMLPEKASTVGKSPECGEGSCEKVLPWRS